MGEVPCRGIVAAVFRVGIKAELDSSEWIVVALKNLVIDAVSVDYMAPSGKPHDIMPLFLGIEADGEEKSQKGTRKKSIFLIHSYFREAILSIIRAMAPSPVTLQAVPKLSMAM